MPDSISIRVDGLSVSYNRKRVLSNIYLNVESGFVYGVIGPNGAGKSTLFKSILGLLEPNAGDIEVLGKEIEDVRQKVAYVPQKDDVDWQFPATVFDIVSMGRYPFKSLFDRLNQEDKAIAMESMELVGITHLKDRQIGALSGGQQQRVFIARALCQQAEIFLLDEPFVGIDITTEETIIRILKDLASRGKTLLVVHHDLATVDDYFHKVILLNQRLLAYGDTDTIFTQENVAKTYGAQLTLLHKAGMVDNK